MPRSLFIRHIQARRAARIATLGYAIGGLIVLFCWGLAANSDYQDARRLECAQAGKFYDQRADECTCQKEVK
jgi:hypothetical protein